MIAVTEATVGLIVVAFIGAAGSVTAAFISHQQRRDIATGNGHSAGEALANIEKNVQGHGMMLAEHTAALQALDQRTAGTNELVSRHLADIGPDSQDLARWVREQMEASGGA